MFTQDKLKWKTQSTLLSHRWKSSRGERLAVLKPWPVAPSPNPACLQRHLQSIYYMSYHEGHDRHLESEDARSCMASHLPCWLNPALLTITGWILELDCLPQHPSWRSPSASVSQELGEALSFQPSILWVHCHLVGGAGSCQSLHHTHVWFLDWKAWPGRGGAYGIPRYPSVCVWSPLNHSKGSFPGLLMCWFKVQKGFWPKRQERGAETDFVTYLWKSCCAVSQLTHIQWEGKHVLVVGGTLVSRCEKSIWDSRGHLWKTLPAANWFLQCW